MKTYLIRSIKYLIWLALLFTLIFVLMIRTNTARAGGEQMLHELFHTQRGWMMIGMLMVLAFLYPRFGFTSRSLKGSVATNRDDILRVAHRGGFSLVSETPGQLVFRASSPAKKALLLWEDTIIVTQQGDQLVIDGIRKEVVRMEFRLKPALAQEQYPAGFPTHCKRIAKQKVFSTLPVYIPYI